MTMLAEDTALPPRRRRVAARTTAGIICVNENIHPQRSPDIELLEKMAGLTFLLIEKSESDELRKIENARKAGVPEAEALVAGQPGTGWERFKGYLIIMRQHGFPIPEDESYFAPIEATYRRSVALHTERRRYSEHHSIEHDAAVALGAALYSWRKPGYWAPEIHAREIILSLMLGLEHDSVEDYGRADCGLKQLNEITMTSGPVTKTDVIRMTDWMGNNSRPLPPDSLWILRKCQILNGNRFKTIRQVRAKLADGRNNCNAFLQESTDFVAIGNHPKDYWKRFDGGPGGTVWYLQGLASTLGDRLSEIDPGGIEEGTRKLLHLFEQDILQLANAVAEQYPRMTRFQPPRNQRKFAEQFGIRL